MIFDHYLESPELHIDVAVSHRGFQDRFIPYLAITDWLEKNPTRL